ncbi:NADH:ubiquinone oxidoreductase subunit 5 (chain L)/multisubunit Na+/H+ antiporter, MnhA subunit [Bernardetia litoralis DSM 6794]|uniref:NADH:ubiquinone oxidoreductase subunit 5 (Chain L)/multisubunit Na+/H+ antiporter, MnhA subunit n=1 Tax=Bernardetia litoralis (strain ATCC 23117 / DSM 6794 / NBRC 15988 / NCIMB 1366 / Fx l1 / Sio-4) TaxID=880071 RepID=I4AIW5_BERLS|nr:proton-conducting transporter membrane subunit [Bernardetia litoralis]AFM03900.1 NADH:ubiquinone oxidoreductase subunit 5 (chain L)/multisubunit Na+/H+ antiporter, MnhA subunit [Bernardetia litoralis DSM 6794]
MNAIYFLIYLFPLLSFLFALLNAIFSTSKRENKFPKKAIEYFALTFSFFALLVTSTQLFEVFNTGKTLSDSFFWTNTGTREINILIKIDAITAFFQFSISLIVFAVHIYSLVYIKTKKLFYYGILGLFVFAMQFLLAQDNLILFFIFWELIGLSSFLLIDFDKTDNSSHSSTKAFLLNRVGDVGFLIAIALLFNYSLSISELKTIFISIPSSTKVIISIGILLAALVKSGQFPFSTWLFDAMEAPTSISALLHAATMVAAGIYLLIRMEFVFQEVKFIAQILLWIVLFSTIFSALTAYFTTNIKQQLAASTVSQLGFMAIAVGVGAWQAAVLHLFTHAFFKATLFLGAGFLIKKNGTKELVQMGKNNYKTLPLFFVIFGFALAALVGFPFTSGFLSKEWILKETLSNQFFIGIGLFMATFLTAFYAARQLQSLFFNKEESNNTKEKFISNSKKWFWYLPLILLFGGSFWFVFSPNPFHPSENYWLKDLPKLVSKAPPYFEIVLPVLAIFLTILGFVLGFSKKLNQKLIGIEFLLNIKSYFLWQDKFFILCFWKPITQTAFLIAHTKPPITTQKIAEFWINTAFVISIFDKKIDSFIDKFSKLIVVCGYFWTWIDKYIVDFITHFVVFLINYAGKNLKTLQNGKVQFYILIVISVLIIALIYLM